MISPTAIQDFEAACESVRFEAERETHQACRKAVEQMPPGHGKRPTLMDGAAAATFEAYAPQLHQLLDQLNGSDPATDADARRQQLGDLIEGHLRKLGHIVEGALRKQVGLPMMALTDPFLPIQLHASVASAVRKYRGQLGFAASTAANTRSQPQVVHSPVFHAPVGNYQAGDGNTATVTQSVVTQVSPDEVKAALDALIQALQHAQGLASDQRAEVVEVLEQVKVEADKEKPNRITVGSLVGGVRDVLEGLQAAPEAWKTVKDWYAFIAANAAVAAPAIGQALRTLSG